MAKSQKSLIVFMPSMDGGGVEKNIILISNFLSKNIKELILITFDNRFNDKFSKKINIINYKKKTNKRYSKYYKYFFCLLLLSKELIFNKNASVLAFQANIYAIILSKLLRFEIIIRSNSSPTGWTNNKIKNYVFMKFFKIPRYIIVNSYDFKKEIDKKFNINTKVIYNPLNKIEIIKRSKEKLNNNFFKEDKVLKIINVARFTNQKDQLTLLRAFKEDDKLINSRLLLIGYGVNKKILLSYIKENKLTKKIKILTFQDNPYKFILKSDIFILTSIYEGLPNVLLEALTLKKFIISSDCPTGPREILNNGKYGFLFKMKDHKDLRQKIIKYKNNKSFYKSYINKGFKSLERFDYNLNCEKYLSLVKKII